MELHYLVIFAIFVVLGTAHYLIRQRHQPFPQIISDAYKAKETLNHYDNASRAKSNQRLHFTFGISNPFTNPNEQYRRDFRKVITKSIKLDWQKIKSIAQKAVNDYTHVETSQECVVVELVPWIQKITLNVVLRGYLGMTNIDKVIDEAPSMINSLWLISKELDFITARKDENLKLILETKRLLKDLFNMEASSIPQQKKQNETHNVMMEISRIARSNFPSAFNKAHSDAADNFESNNGFHNPSGDDLVNSLNVIIPAYETMWRVVLYAILEIKIRPLLRNKETTEGNANIDFEKLDDAVKVFLEKPKNVSKVPPLCHVIQETLRLYPPTRHIHREKEGLRVTVDVEAIHRDPKIWGDDALLFNPERFHKKPEEASFIPFSVGPLKCVAAEFAPTFAAIIISVILNRVKNVTLNQEKKETLFQKENIPFENSRRAFDKFKVNIY
ncbi:9142_t:CDS:1 [Funneliformis geosporum]|uniref:1101_t:CDS:1 n=1 Tax=Funneliformis geosporum TaxID=1117311 RepID=A0A9W4SJZ1_9GLOM|nr:9142_t:CDS:1 [Funneliformis geosporum]CAI2172278.1 1101_t:CDS:1 [Funneliformis geosporum]